MATQLLLIFYLSGAAAAFCNNVVNGRISELESRPVASAYPFLLAKQQVLVPAVRAVTSRLWNRSPIDCCKCMLTSSTVLVEISVPVQRRLRFSGATQVAASRR